MALCEVGEPCEKRFPRASVRRSQMGQDKSVDIDLTAI